MATVIYRCPVGAPGECPTSATRGYCQVHMFQQLERYDPAADVPPPPSTPPSTPPAAAPPAPEPARAAVATEPAPGPGRPPAPEPATRPAQRRPARQPVAVRLALVIAGAMLPVRDEHRRGGGGLAIGRDEPDCAAVPGLAALDQISRHHARLRWIDGALYVEDQGSTNGTFVDGRRITAPTRIGPGQRLRFARDVDAQLIEIDEFGAPR
ncbi:FHA domain-containing protein [Kitasatospora sp. NPDC058115]|uniref:FHA domain-containing protein n=2 Tax=unclassified Kitasatospora TaxID=2633591 RepID=UPI0036DB23E7